MVAFNYKLLDIQRDKTTWIKKKKKTGLKTKKIKRVTDDNIWEIKQELLSIYTLYIKIRRGKGEEHRWKYWEFHQQIIICKNKCKF